MKKEKKDKKAKKGAEVVLAKPGGIADEPTPFQLKDIHVSVGRDELIGVIGTVGSGKSSLLAALAGDMRKTGGSGTLGATRAFCPQYAWIQNATVKENIVFGRDFNAPWYNKVVDACALRADLEMLPAGDATEIGERGITISGGQKQRLNIARAIYFNADIILLDDPLSAVDAHVGRHIMDNAICGLLKGKCRILATHQLHVISRCDRIVWMDGGRIRAVDTYDNLMAKDVDFQKLLATTAAEGHDEDSEKDDDAEKDEKKADKEKTPRRKRGGPLMTVEDRAVAAVSMRVYLAYVKAAGGYWVFPLVITALILSMGANILTSQWLAWWTSNKFFFPLGKYVSLPTVVHRVRT
jgi:ATP-binding cassette subfamily C (CFTR/MRP) protein 1